MEANKETEKLLSPKRRSKGAERQKEEGGISGKDIAMFGAEMIPGVGEAMAVKRTSDALDEKDYLGAGIEATAGLLGIIPGVGDAAGKTLRATTKGLRKEKTETIPVFPKPERMFPEGERPKGGKYLNPITGDDLTGMNVPNANLKINPDGKPSFNVTNKNVDSVGTTGKGNTQIKTNLFKSKAGWKWKDSTVDTDNINTLISVTHKGKHYYTLETDFSKGVTLKNYPESKTEPKLRPTVQGQLEMGTPIGTISVRGVEHPVYDKVITFAEGGVVPMNRQMSMFDDGGLMDEGGTVDPVSGNDVPPGSTQEEVRDDIPAQLSEGEFVFPADVVRYIGLGNLMRMRQEAKMGLKLMDEMGQMGNSEEATMPDDLPFDINDLDMEDELEYNVGGFVQPTQQQQQMGISGFQQAAVPTTGVAATPQQAASQQYVQPVRPQQAAVPTMPAYQPSEIPTFKGFVGENIPGVEFEYVDYTNEAGNIIKLRKSKTTGELLDPVPEGYTFVDPDAIKIEEVTTTPTTPQTTSVREEGEGENRPEPRGAVFSLGTFSEDGRMGGKRGEDYFDFNVSFDTRKEGSIPGTINALGLVSGLATGKGVPDGTIATLEYGGTEIKVGADEYNAAREDRTGNKAQELINRFKEKRDKEVLAAKTLAAEYGIKYKGQTLAEMAKATNAIDAERKKEATKLRKEAEKAEKDAISFEQLIGSGADNDRGDGRGMDVFEAAEAFQQEKQDSGEGRPDQSSGSPTGGYYDFNQGGLASKPKPKAKKKMKKGGLASKK